MYKNNIQEISKQIKENDIVLDIGGWFCPFNRANWVIDAMPYETRRKSGIEGVTKEYFSKQTWLQMDICDRKSLPFRDKEIDFVICSHILEDIRDPIFVCSEISRIGKRGYIEAPSKIAELSLGIESRHYAGYCHHRWIIEIKDNKIIFLNKPHFIHSHWKFHFPYNYGKRLTENDSIQWLFWNGAFEFEERIAIDYEGLSNGIEKFVRSEHVYPNCRYKIDNLKKLVKKRCVLFISNKTLH